MEPTERDSKLFLPNKVLDLIQLQRRTFFNILLMKNGITQNTQTQDIEIFKPLVMDFQITIIITITITIIKSQRKLAFMR